MLKIRLLTIMAGPDHPPIDSGTVLLLPEEKAKVLLDAGHAEPFETADAPPLAETAEILRSLAKPRGKK